MKKSLTHYRVFRRFLDFTKRLLSLVLLILAIIERILRLIG